MIVDFHVHVARYEQPTPSLAEWTALNSGADPAAFYREWDDPARYVAYMDANGVDYSVVLAEISPITTGVATNEQVLDFCAASPRLLPFATVNPFTVHDPARVVETLVTERGMRGLKLYPTYNYFYPNDALIYPIYAVAERLGIPVMVHTGSSVFAGARLKYGDPLFLDDVAVDFPRLPLLITHGGRPFWYDRAGALARLHPRVYIEIGGLPPRRLREYFDDLDRLAPKLVFGSDWPGIPGRLAENIAAVRELGLSAASSERILGGNAAELLGLGR